MIRDYRARPWRMTLPAATMMSVVAAAGLSKPPVARTDPLRAAAVAGSQETAPGESRLTQQKDAAGASQQAPFEIKGQCLDDDGEPLRDVEVVLFYFDHAGAAPAEVGRQKTRATGEYRFEKLKALSEADDLSAHYIVAARKPKHASSIRSVINDTRNGDLDLTLSSDVGVLSGRITDERGEPVKGSDVFVGIAAPLPGFMQAVTDQDGRYSISDLKCWEAVDLDHADPKTGLRFTATRAFFLIKYPGYPVTRGAYSGIPQEVDVELNPGMTIEGRVFDTVTRKPAAGAVVSAQGNNEDGWAQVIADNNGVYRLVLTADTYNIWARAKDRTCVALDSFWGPAGETTEAADLELISGGLIVGKVVDRATGKPLDLPNGHPLYIGHHGPAFPKSGAAVGIARVADDGTYRLRVAPGDNYPYVMIDVDFERTPRNAMKLPPIVVDEGETVTLDFHAGPIAEE